MMSPKTEKVQCLLQFENFSFTLYIYAVKMSRIQLDYFFIAGSFRVSLFIDLGCPRDLGKGWRGDLGTFMISRPP